MGQFANARHLLRARDWLVVLEPAASEAARIAALTHDCERAFPGGPRWSADDEPDDRVYRDMHARRSADIAAAWLREQGADDLLVDRVHGLVLDHEWGGSAEADLVQAADSLSFLEVQGDLFAEWVAEGRCSPQRAIEQFRWMHDRIRVDRARPIASSLLATVEKELLP